MFSFIIVAISTYYYHNPKEFARYFPKTHKILRKVPKWAFLMLLSLLSYTFLLFTKIQIIPDSLGAATAEHGNSLDLIVGSLASLSGIVIAVLIISYEVLKGKLGRHSQKYFLENSNLIFLAFLFTYSISIAFVSKLIVSSSAFQLNNQINVAYYSYLFFLACLILLVPFSIRIISSFNIYKIISKEINKVTLHEILNTSKTPDYLAGIEFDSANEKYPLSILGDLALNNLDKDYIVTKVISRELAVQFTDILKKVVTKGTGGKLDFTILKPYNNYTYYEENIDFFKPYIKLLEQITSGATRTNNHIILESLSVDFYYVLSTAIGIKTDFKELTSTIDSFVEFCIIISHTRNDDLLYGTLTYMEKLIIECLEAYPLDEEKINELYEAFNAPKGDFEEGFKWTLLIDHWISAFQKIHRSSVETQNDYLFNIAPLYITSLVSEIIDVQSLGPLQKGKVTIWQYVHLCENCLNGLKNGLDRSKIDLGLSAPVGGYIVRAIKRKSPQLRELLIHTGNYLMRLSQLDGIDSIILHRLEILILWLVEKGDENVKKQGVSYLLKVLKFIKKEIEKSLESNHEAYLQLKKTTNSIAKQVDKLNYTRLKKDLQDLQATFMETPNPRWIDGHGYVKWEEE